MIKIRHHIQMHSRTTRTVPIIKKSANRHFHRHRHLCHYRPFFLSTSTPAATSTYASTHASTHAASAFSSWSLENASQGLLSLLTNQQRTLLDEQKELSSKALKLAHEIGGVNLQYCSTATSPFLQQIISPYDNETDNGGGNGNINVNGGNINGGDGKHSDEILDSTFSVVIAGEFNAGKSTLINALLGQKLLETGALPTTDTITVLASKQQQQQKQQNSNDQSSPSSSPSSSPTIETTTSHSNAITIHRVPNIPLLNDLTFIDTPGTNAIISLNHTQRTIKLLPSADLILFVTSADRPFPESERKLLHSIQAYRKNIVIIINKMDILESSGGNYGQLEKEKVRDFVRLNASDLLGLNVMIFNVSARDALSSKLIHGRNRSSGSMSMSHGGNHSSNSNSNNNEQDRDRIESSKMWQRSGFASLESFLKESLTEEAKIQAKLLNPLGVTDGMLSECLHVLEDRKKELEIDIATYNLLKNQMKSWRYDMDNDIREFQDDVRGHMVKEMERCNSFIDSIGFFEKYSLCLFDNDGNESGSGSKLESKWEDTKSVIVSNDIEQEILESIRESTDAIATSARAQGQAVIEYLGKRPAIVGQNLIGSVTAASRFEDTRKELYEKITKSLENVLASYDAEKEKKDVFQSLKHTVYLSSSLHILSVASGLVTAFEMVDIFQGGLATFSFAVVGFGVVPQRNRFMVKDFEKRWEERNEKLSSALDVLCAKEIKRIHKRILHGVSPYSRYVTSEQENVETYTEECHALSATSQSLRNRIAKLK